MLKKILSHSFWLIIGTSIGKLAMFVTNIVAARLLSQEIFGQFTMIRSTINMGGNIVSGALGPAATKRIAEVNQTDKNRLPSLILAIFAINGIAIVIISLTILIFSEWIINTFFLGTTNLVFALYIGLFLLFGSTFSIISQSILIGFEQFRKIASINVVVSLTSIPVILFLIYALGLYGALFGISFYFIFDASLKIISLKSKIQPIDFRNSLSKSVKYFKALANFSLPLAFALLLNSVSFWYARVIIINTSDSFNDIAIFDAAYQWLTIIMMITGVITNVALPMLSKALAGEKKDEFYRVFYLNLAVNSGIALSIAVIFILLSKQIMGLYGTAYVKGNHILIILSLMSVFFSVSSIYNKYMLTINKVWIIFFSSLFGVIVLFTSLVFLASYHALGLAWSFFSYYFASVILYLISFKYLKYSGRK